MHQTCSPGLAPVRIGRGGRSSPGTLIRQVSARSLAAMTPATGKTLPSCVTATACASRISVGSIVITWSEVEKIPGATAKAVAPIMKRHFLDFGS